MGKEHVAGWHPRARTMWRDGFTDGEIALAIGVTRSAVQAALRIPRIVEGDYERGTRRSSGQTRATTRSRCAGAATDELDCVSMMQALQNGVKGSRSYLKRYAGDF